MIVSVVINQYFVHLQEINVIFLNEVTSSRGLKQNYHHYSIQYSPIPKFTSIKINIVWDIATNKIISVPNDIDTHNIDTHASQLRFQIAFLTKCFQIYE